MPAEPAYVTLAETQYEIHNLADEVTVRLDLMLQPGVAGVEPKLADVALGKRHDQNLLHPFSVEMEKTDDTKLIPTLLVKIKTRELEQGTYNLRIEVRPAVGAPGQPASTLPANARRLAQKSDPARAAKPQTLKVEIILPAATLQAPSPLVIEQVRPFLFNLDSPEPQNLDLAEASMKKLRLTNVNVRQTYIAGGESKATGERVEFASVAEVTPTKTGSSEITLKGDFPLGTTKGSALITAPQLANPVPLGFEVRARRPRSAIITVIIFGLLAGFATRVWAKRRLELNEARLKAIDAAKTLEAELARRPDQPFNERLREPKERLRTAIQRATVAELNESIAAANVLLKEALADLDARRTTARADLQALKELAGNRAHLPPEVTDAFAVNERLVVEIGRLIEIDDVARAQAAVDDVVSHLGREIGEAVSTWRVNEGAFLEEVAVLAAFLPSSTAAGLGEDVASLNTKLDELPPIGEAARPEQVAKLSNSLREARMRIGELLLKIRGRLTISADTLSSQFEQVIDPFPERILRVVEMLTELRQSLVAWADRPETGAQKLHATLVSIKALWRDALLAQIAGAHAKVVAETKTAVQALIDQDKYLDASLRVVQYLRDNPSGDQILGEGENVATAAMSPQAVVDDSLIALLSRGVAGDRTATHSVHEKTIPPSLDQLRVNTLGEIFLDRAIPFVVAGLIILAIGYSLFADKFVGTFTDLLAVFVWAYGVDISVQAVMETGKSLKK
jgi:hypothetical protein